MPTCLEAEKSAGDGQDAINIYGVVRELRIPELASMFDCVLSVRSLTSLPPFVSCALWALYAAVRTNYYVVTGAGAESSYQTF
jgi:hypothetical protein